MKQITICALAMVLLMAPAAFASKRAPARMPPPSTDLIVSTLFGEKLNPVVRFPAGSHLERIHYDDHAGAPGGVYNVNVLYSVTSQRRFKDVVSFYIARYPSHPLSNMTTGPHPEWSMYFGRGTARTELFTVTDVRKAHVSGLPARDKPSSLVLCMVSLPPASVARFKAAHEGDLEFPVPR